MAGGELQLVGRDLNPAELAWQATLSNLHHIAGASSPARPGDQA